MCLSGQEGDTPLRLVCSCNFQSAAKRTIALKALLDAGADPNFFRDIAAARAEAERARVAAASAGHMLGQMKLDGSPSAVYAFVHGAAKLHELQERMTTMEAAERAAGEVDRSTPMVRCPAFSICADVTTLLGLV